MKTHIKALLVICVSFLLGVLYTDYHYRDIPRDIFFEVRSPNEVKYYTALEQCKGLSKELIRQEVGIVNFVDELLMEYDGRFNGGRPIDQDRYDDLYLLQKDRSAVSDTLSRL